MTEHVQTMLLFFFSCHAVQHAELPLTRDQTYAPCSESTVFKKFFYLFMAALGLHHCVGFPLAALSGGCALAVVCRLVIATASLVAEHGL